MLLVLVLSLERPVLVLHLLDLLLQPLDGLRLLLELRPQLLLVCVVVVAVLRGSVVGVVATDRGVLLLQLTGAGL